MAGMTAARPAIAMGQRQLLAGCARSSSRPDPTVSDPSSATLTLTIEGADDGVTITGLDLNGGEVLVDEDDLPDGTDRSDPLSQSGSFAITAPDGIDTISIGGQTFTYAQLANSGSVNLMIDSPAGVLMITEAGGTVTNHLGKAYRLDDPGIVASNGGIHEDLVAAVGLAIPEHIE